MTFYFSDAKKIALEIADPVQYITNASQAILKKVVSRYPFESKKEGQLCLRLHSRQISHDLTNSLSHDLKPAGVSV